MNSKPEWLWEGCNIFTSHAVERGHVSRKIIFNIVSSYQYI